MYFFIQIAGTEHAQQVTEGIFECAIEALESDGYTPNLEVVGEFTTLVSGSKEDEN